MQQPAFTKSLIDLRGWLSVDHLIPTAYAGLINGILTSVMAISSAAITF